MRTDIRIVSVPDEELGGEMYQVARVTYDDQGEIFVGRYYIHYESPTMEGCLLFVDEMYKASLKPVLVKLDNGEWE